MTKNTENNLELKNCNCNEECCDECECECECDCDDSDFDFSELSDSFDNGNQEVIDFMQGILGSCHEQMRTALELTKLITEKSVIKDINEDKIFAIYQKALKVTVESFPLTEMLAKVPGEL